MEKHIHLFSTQAEFEAAYNGSEYKEPWLSYTENKGIDYNEPNIDYSSIPFTIEALSSGNITWALSGKTVQYSKNSGSWQTMTENTTITVVKGDEVQFKGTNGRYAYYDSEEEEYINCNISSTAQFNVKGNIMSLISGDGFLTAVTISEKYALYGLLYENTNLISANKLILPATTLADYCYQYMFDKCSSLVAGPKQLPALTLTKNCYEHMFSYCPNLISVPLLPATTLAAYCYYCMFSNCTSLTRAPELPATTLTNKNCCYNYMFRGCTNLNYIKAMFTTTPTSTYTNDWVDGVSQTGTFVKNASATWTNTGIDAIPTGWTVQTATS